MEPETRKVVLWEVKRTEKAILFQTFFNPDEGKDIWIPRSVIHHISRNPPCPGEPTYCILDVEEWFLAKNDM